MQKPNSWTDLPGSLLERFLWDQDLDYDGYESSKAETIHMIMCDTSYCNSRNEDILDTAWKYFKVEDLEQWIRGEIVSLERQVITLKALLC